MYKVIIIILLSTLLACPSRYSTKRYKKQPVSQVSIQESKKDPNVKTNYQQDGVTKSSDVTYWGNGKPKTAIVYYSDGRTIKEEITHWKNGNIKTKIEYYTSGNLHSIECYSLIQDNSPGTPPWLRLDNARETCTQARHGCTRYSTTCIN